MIKKIQKTPGASFQGLSGATRRRFIGTLCDSNLAIDERQKTNVIGVKSSPVIAIAAALIFFASI